MAAVTCLSCGAPWGQPHLPTCEFGGRTPAQRRDSDGRYLPTGRTHGRPGTYRACGCRCQPCRDAHAAAKRAYLARRRATQMAEAAAATRARQAS